MRFNSRLSTWSLAGILLAAIGVGGCDDSSPKRRGKPSGDLPIQLGEQPKGKVLKERAGRVQGAFREVAQDTKLPGNTPGSPFDMIKKPQIPFEVRRPKMDPRWICMNRGSLYFMKGSVYMDFRAEKSALRRVDNDQEVIRVRFTTPGCVSPDGKWMLDQLFRKLYRSSRMASAKYFGERIDSETPKSAAFSPKSTYAVLHTSNGLELYSLSQRRIVQSINGFPPFCFSEDELWFYCRSGNWLMIYKWNGQKYVGQKKVELSASKYGFNSREMVIRDGYIVIPNHINGRASEKNPFSYGLTVYKYNKDAVELVFSKEILGLLNVDKVCIRGRRFAVSYNTSPIADYAILVYGDAETGKVKFFRMPSKTKLLALDVSGRYAFRGGGQVYRLEYP